MTKHKQTVVSLNGIEVEVDVGIACLVKALSMYKSVSTFESCQGSNHGAFVRLHYYGSEKNCVGLYETTGFAQYLAKTLRGLSDCVVSVVFGTLPYVLIEMHPLSIKEASIKVARHSCGFAGGTQDTILRN